MELKETIVKWDPSLKGVFIQDEGEVFVLLADRPSIYSTFTDARRYFIDCVLPSVHQLQLVSKHLPQINEIIKSNNGFEIWGLHWSNAQLSPNSALAVSLLDGTPTQFDTDVYFNARPVYDL